MLRRNNKTHTVAPRYLCIAAWMAWRPGLKEADIMSKSRALLMAVSLMAAPLGVAMAQGTASSSPGTTDGRSAATMNGKSADSAAAANPNVPGATGQTVVPGSKSSIAGAAGVHPDPKSATTSAGGTGGGSK